MKILVTGGCGFIGSNFIINEINNGSHEILNFDKLTYAGNSDNLFKIEDHAKYRFIHGDICDSSALRAAIFSFSPDSIIHFAAESHVDRSIDNPIEFINTNVTGTANLLIEGYNYWKKSKKKDFKFLHISTDEVYGSLNGEEMFTEKSRYNPSSPYSASKAGSDHLVRSWYNTYRFPIIITHCSNNYGPYQFPEKLIPLMIANCIDEKALPVYGRGLNIRDWLFVDDHCQAITKVLLEGKIGETYNIGGNNEIKNIDLVKIICSKLDELSPRKNGSPYEELITYVTDRPGHDFRYSINSSKIKKEINWAPKETFDTGIRKTIHWYLNNEDWWRKTQKKIYNQERLGIKK